MAALPYPLFHFPKFQSLMVNHGPKIGEHSIIKYIKRDREGRRQRDRPHLNSFYYSILFCYILLLIVNIPNLEIKHYHK